MAGELGDVLDCGHPDADDLVQHIAHEAGCRGIGRDGCGCPHVCPDCCPDCNGRPA